MATLKHFVLALKRQVEVEKYITEELMIPVEFVDLLDPDLSFRDVECIWTDMTMNINASFLSNFPSLKYIASPTTGLTHLKLSELQIRNLKIVSLKGETEFLNLITSTAEFAWGLALSVWRRIPQSSTRYTDDISIRSEFAGLQLRNLSIGAIGYGRLGKMLSSYARGFDMKTLYFDPFLDKQQAPDIDSVYRCESLEELCRESDIIFLVASHHIEHAAQYPILDREHLALIRPHAIVVNVSRGSLLDEEALADCLTAGKIFGAGIDVLLREETGDSGISRLQALQKSGFNVVVTPHLGGMCSDAFELAHRFTAKKLGEEIFKHGSLNVP